MDYKKLYEKAVERAKTLTNSGFNDFDFVKHIFPELKESEDEKMRKIISDILLIDSDEIREILDSNNVLIQDIDVWLEKQGDANKEYWRGYREGKQEILDKYAWLEKQGEQKPTDKAEPKFNFKVSQWIVATGECVYLIAKIDGFNVTLVDTNGDKYVFDASSLDDAHEWTIEDAKDGDVLATDNGCICIFDGTVEEGKYPFAYCGVIERVFENCDGQLPFTHANVQPATKEQRDKLEKAMADAGYTFDFEKKELKKIEQKPADKVEPKFKVKYAGSEYNVFETKDIAGVTFYGIEDEPNHIDYVKADNCKIISGYGIKESGLSFPTKPVMFSEQKPWNEEDEEMLNSFLHKLEVCDLLSNKESIWIKNKLKSLKDRVGNFDDGYKVGFSAAKYNQWKPSEEQITALAKNVEYVDVSCTQPILKGLLEELKKLREE